MPSVLPTPVNALFFLYKCYKELTNCIILKLYFCNFIQWMNKIIYILIILCFYNFCTSYGNFFSLRQVLLSKFYEWLSLWSTGKANWDRWHLDLFPQYIEIPYFKTAKSRSQYLAIYWDRLGTEHTLSLDRFDYFQRSIWDWKNSTLQFWKLKFQVEKLLQILLNKTHLVFCNIK